MLLTMPRWVWPTYWEKSAALYHTPRLWHWFSCTLCVGRPWRLRLWLDAHEAEAKERLANA